MEFSRAEGAEVSRQSAPGFSVTLTRNQFSTLAIFSFLVAAPFAEAMLVPCTTNLHLHSQNVIGDLDLCDLELDDWDYGDSKGQRD